MTSIYFIRHAQPDETWTEDATRPLTPLGKADAASLPQTLGGLPISAVYASTYKRSIDTVSPLAAHFGLPLHTDGRLRERKAGPARGQEGMLRRRWEDFDYCEPEGECLRSVQKRNLAALDDLLAVHPGQSIVVGTHGTALSTILHTFDPGFGCAGFLRLHDWLPYVIRLDFEAGAPVASEDILILARGY